MSKHVAPLKALSIAAVALVAACSVGPDYHRPDAPVPAAYKEGWKPGEPQDATDRGAWWSIYADPVLDDLEKQVEVSNQNLRAAEAAYREARAVVAQASAGYYPTISVAASATRSGQGGSSSTSGITGPTGVTSFGRGNRTLYDLSADASWSLDLWGRIRRTVESDVANAQASAADLASARLSAQATLATNYFDLRSSDELQRLLDAAVVAFTQSLQITRNQYRVGVAGQADVVTAETQVETTRAQAVAVGIQRAQFEHAIAVLIGKPPGDFSIAVTGMPNTIPIAPTDVPSTLLERRPDIAAAERLMAAANAQIGAAEAAYYPDLTLSASYGVTSTSLGNLLRTSNALWSIGPTLTETLFNGGLRGAQLDQARAVYDQNVATYRQTVLTGFQQVEDQLAALRILARQAEVEANAVRLAREAERLTLNQYKAGTVAYTAVITAQTQALTNEQTDLTILQNRLAASVALIQALGGGWTATQLPSDGDVKQRSPLDLLR
jgi:NodT family efflux transporter outer membrane factor (OMF) lipoprotein